MGAVHMLCSSILRPPLPAGPTTLVGIITREKCQAQSLLSHVGAAHQGFGHLWTLMGLWTDSGWASADNALASGSPPRGRAAGSLGPHRASP